MIKKKLHEPLEERKGNLYFDGFSVKELAEKYDTPLYLMSEKRIRDNYDRLYGALVNNYKYVRIYYAAKANTNLNVLKILQSQGAYLDTVSPGEVFLALKRRLHTRPHHVHRHQRPKRRTKDAIRRQHHHKHRLPIRNGPPTQNFGSTDSLSPR